MEMQALAFPLMYLMVALNPATGQWEGYNAFDFPDQETCLANRQAWGDAVLGDAGKYFCLAYKDTRYMMETLQKGHWLPLDGRGHTYGSGHGVGNQSYDSKEACLAARKESLTYGGSYRCMPYSYSYVDNNDPPPWTLQFRDRPRERPSWRGRWFYTRAECVEMGGYMLGRYISVERQATFECIHSEVQKSGRSQ
jgi:hypothetical protein